MKKNILMLSLMAVSLIACGKTNKINSESTGSVNTLIADISNVEGNYDLIESNHFDCGANIQIVKACDGLKIMSNRGIRQEFCHINQGEVDSKVNTFSGNELKSVFIFHRAPNTPPDAGNRENRISTVETLQFRGNGILTYTIATQMKGSGQCTYQKR
jgi:hypothetical protein